MEFGHFCICLESLKLNYDRLELAKGLVEAIATNALPSTNLSTYAWGDNSSLNEVELHRKAAVQALEAASVTSLQAENTMLSTQLHRKTWTPPANTLEIVARHTASSTDRRISFHAGLDDQQEHTLGRSSSSNGTVHTWLADCACHYPAIRAGVL